MIDAAWMLWSRALLDYAKAATTWLLTRTRRDVITNMTDQTMKTNTIEHQPQRIARKIGYAVTGLVFALVVGPLFVIGAYTILTSFMSF
jgi:hypothetical protein